LPGADAIVNPNQPGCDFPAKYTCGAAVAWYLLVATRAVLKARGGESAETASRLDIGSLLDMVAFATIADVVPLGYNNRILVNAGLKRIRAGKTRAGIRALAAVAGVHLEHITAQDFGFLLGPRINAAGRLEDMRTGVRLLLTEDIDEAEQLALELHQTNQRRRNIESTMRSEAETMIQDAQVMMSSVPEVLCLRGDSWHEGVVGIVAGRIKEQWHRPALAFAPGEDGALLKGSARSVPGLHIRDVLAEVNALQPGLILRFGGHAMAAGLTIRPKDFEPFKAVLEQVVHQKITPEMMDAAIFTDGELSPKDCTINTALELDTLGIWGNEFPEPLFFGTFLIVESGVMSGGHWRMRVRMDGEPDGEPLVGVRFLRGEEKDHPPSPPGVGERISGTYTLKVNRWRGKETLQVIFQDALK
jgi:single-stranded-DNA-specific exonuclease